MMWGCGDEGKRWEEYITAVGAETTSYIILIRQEYTLRNQLNCLITYGGGLPAMIEL